MVRDLSRCPECGLELVHAWWCRCGKLVDDRAALRARVAQLEAALIDAEDFRAEIVLDAFTAPDADWLTILDSLRARIRDLAGGVREDGCYTDPLLDRSEGE